MYDRPECGSLCKQTGPRLLDAALEAPRLGLEPRTYRLTAGRSTIELSGIVGCHAAGLGAAPERPRAQDSPKLVQTRPNFVRASRNSITLPLSVNSGPRSTLAARGSRSFLDRTALGPACEKEFSTPSRKRGGVLVYGSGVLDSSGRGGDDARKAPSRRGFPTPGRNPARPPRSLS